jgi:putative ABC transport system permease protein
MDRLLQNIRLAVRSLYRTPGFALTAILTLALGIGLSTAVFTVADALLLRGLPVQDQDRIVVLSGVTRDGRFDNYPLGLADAREFARRTRALEKVAFFAYEGAWPKPIRDGDNISRFRRALVSGDFFDVLGTKALLGRALQPSDDVIGAPRVMVLSYAAWQHRFGGDPHILGHQLRVFDDAVTYTIVGVMPQGLDYPRGAELWAPLVPARTLPGTDLTFADVDIIGRLAPPATPANARDELTVFFRRADASPVMRDLRGVVQTLPRLVLGETRPAVIVFGAAVALLLLITCTNVANLLMVRGLARVREIAVRCALGASRGQVIVQLLTENTLLAIAGGALGLLLATVAVRVFVTFAPAQLPRLDEIQLNANALAGAFGITCAAMLIFGLAPAVIASRVDLQQALRSGTRQSTSRRSRLAAETMVAGQIALALLVLSAAGLIARSLIKLERADLSFDSSHLLIAELAVRYDQFGNAPKQLALLDELLPRIQALPGVRTISPVVALPFAGPGGWDSRPAAEGQSAAEAEGNPMLNMEVVAPAYFVTFGIPVLRGRVFTDADRKGTQDVVVISQSTARHYWPGDDAIGKRLKMGPGLKQTLTVIGVVPDTRYRELRDARPSIYFPLNQSQFPFVPMTLAIRTSIAPAELVPALRHAIGEASSGLALGSAAPFETFLDAPLAQPRLNALLLAVFASACVAMAALGLFGVMTTMVRQRTRELGVRMALGATAGNLRRMVMRRALAIATAGMLVGLLGALLANRLLVAMLYEVSPVDITTLVVAAGLLLTVATLASLIPARSTTRIDPAIALRAEA